MWHLEQADNEVIGIGVNLEYYCQIKMDQTLEYDLLEEGKNWASGDKQVLLL